MDSVPSTHIVITAAGPSSQHADAIGELCASRATSAGAGLLSHIRSVRSAPARVAEPHQRAPTKHVNGEAEITHR